MHVFTGWLKLKRAPALLALVSFLAVAEQTVEVSIEKYVFTPQEVTIRVGDSVKWINREKRTSHSVLFPQKGGVSRSGCSPTKVGSVNLPNPADTLTLVALTRK
jgi:plastocyanin